MLNLRKELLVLLITIFMLCIAISSVSANDSSDIIGINVNNLDESIGVEESSSDIISNDINSVSNSSNINSNEDELSTGSDEINTTGNTTTDNVCNDTGTDSTTNDTGNVDNSADVVDDSTNNSTINTNDSITNTNSKGNVAIWVKSSDMGSVNFATLAKYGVNQIFLNYYAYTKFSESYVNSWIANATKNSINVHIWVQVFYDDGWINPIKNGVIDTTFLNKKINECLKYASMPNVAGIHLDYLRFPGTAYKYEKSVEAINTFVKNVVTKLKDKYPKIIISAAVMPESISSDKYYYGQDIVTLSKYLDIICPMAYKGNYKQSSAWIKSVTSTFVKASLKAQIWTGLQTYKSDDDLVKLSVSALSTDCKNAVNGGASGFGLFRYGLTNYFNFTSCFVNSTTQKVSLGDILKAAVTVKNYMAKHSKKMPSSITVGKYKVSSAKFSYLMSVAILNIKNKKLTSKITIKSVSSTKHIRAKLNKVYSRTTYLKATKSIYTYFCNHKIAPAYVKIGSKKANFRTYNYAFTRILAFYKSNKALPKTCLFVS